MINVNQCPYCREPGRIELMKQEFKDVYIELIDPDLNSEARYWHKCTNCGFIYRSPKLNEKEQDVLYEKYRDVSFRSETPDEYFDRIIQYNDLESENYQKITWVINNIKYTTPDKIDTVLDVGCGGGVLLHKIKKILPHVATYGVEPNDLYSELARKRSGANRVVTSYFHPYPILFDEKFDMIVSSDVLEHVDSTSTFLRNIFLSLKSNIGVLFLEVPSPTNFEELDCEHDMFNIAHHVFFTKAILEKYLHSCGFKNVYIEDVKNNNNIWKLRALAYKV